MKKTITVYQCRILRFKFKKELRSMSIRGKYYSYWFMDDSNIWVAHLPKDRWEIELTVICGDDSLELTDYITIGNK